VAVRVDGLAAVGEVAAILSNSSGPDLVEGGNPLVELGASRVAREPERLAVVGRRSASVMLLLSLVYDGDACPVSEQGHPWPSRLRGTDRLSTL
jgi:hypothetical protein